MSDREPETAILVTDAPGNSWRVLLRDSLGAPTLPPDVLRTIIRNVARASIESAARKHAIAQGAALARGQQACAESVSRMATFQPARLGQSRPAMKLANPTLPPDAICSSCGRRNDQHERRHPFTYVAPAYRPPEEVKPDAEALQKAARGFGHNELYDRIANASCVLASQEGGGPRSSAEHGQIAFGARKALEGTFGPGVLLAIESELAHQRATGKQPAHSFTAWLLIIRHITDEAEKAWYDGESDPLALKPFLRKIAAVCMAGMCQEGPPPARDEDPPSAKARHVAAYEAIKRELRPGGLLYREHGSSGIVNVNPLRVAEGAKEEPQAAFPGPIRPDVASELEARNRAMQEDALTLAIDAKVTPRVHLRTPFPSTKAPETCGYDPKKDQRPPVVRSGTRPSSGFPGSPKVPDVRPGPMPAECFGPSAHPSPAGHPIVNPPGRLLDAPPDRN